MLASLLGDLDVLDCSIKSLYVFFCYNDLRRRRDFLGRLHNKILTRIMLCVYYMGSWIVRGIFRYLDKLYGVVMAIDI